MFCNKPHAVCIPGPAQSHIKAVLKLAKLLHRRGFYVTFVNTEFNHKRFLKSLGPNSLNGFPDFQFETIPDGLPDSNEDSTQDLTLLCDSVRKEFLAPFRDLLMKLNNTETNPPVTCIVSDCFMSMFSIVAAEEIGVPIALFFTVSASTFMGFKQFRTLVQKGLAPFKGEYITSYMHVHLNTYILMNVIIGMQYVVSCNFFRMGSFGIASNLLLGCCR